MVGESLDRYVYWIFTVLILNDDPVQEAVLPPRADIIWGQHCIDLETMRIAAACLCDGSTWNKEEILQLFPTEEYVTLNNDFTMPVRGLDYTKKGESSLRTL